MDAQQSNAQAERKQESLIDLFHKHTYTGQYPLPQLPKASPSLRSRAYDASGEPFVFPDKVWFPGEWEEVKAIVVSPEYYHQVPEHEGDARYYADPLVEGWGAYYFQEESYTQPEIIGSGPYKSKVVTDTERGKTFFYIMDGIQRGGAEAWVRIEQAEDEQNVRQTLQEMGLRNDKLRFFISSGNAFWFRDCGPICFYYGDDDEIAMLDFLYGSRPLDDLLPSVLHRQMGIPNYISSVVWEGGNCLVDGVGGLVTSTAVYASNSNNNGPIVWDGQDVNTISQTTKPALSSAETKTALRHMLGQRLTTVLPRLVHDGFTGHVDIYVDATDENGFLFTELPTIYEDWSDYDLIDINASYMFQKPSFWGRRYYDKGRLPFPAMDDGSPFESENDYAWIARTYANHTFVNNVILQPCFSPVGTDHMPTADWDRANVETLKKRYPGYTFYCIDMRVFDGTGGSVHCVTKQIPADNPIRILHKNIHGNVNPGNLTAIPFSAVITNKSGIEQASLVYRTANADQWHTVPLTANGNRFSCTVPLSDLLPVGTRRVASASVPPFRSEMGQPLQDIPVDYYFQVTSRNGKTITKPLNALTGSLYSFTLTSDAPYDEQMFDFSTEPVDKDLITFTLSSNYLVEDTSEDTVTGISEPEANSQLSTLNSQLSDWFTINGIRLGQKPTAKGVYIRGNRKVVIK